MRTIIVAALNLTLARGDVTVYVEMNTCITIVVVYSLFVEWLSDSYVLRQPIQLWSYCALHSLVRL